MSESATETTSLLTRDVPQADEAVEATEDNPVQSSAHFARAIRTINIIILGDSYLTLFVLFATFVLLSVSPFHGYYYSTVDALYGAGLFTLSVFISAIVNLRYRLPIGFNVLLDILLACFSVAALVSLSSNNWQGQYWCSGPTSTECTRWKLAFQSMIVLCFIGCSILGLAHFVLFILRTITAYKSRSWTRPLPWRFPAGQITFEFTIKVLRQDTRGGPTSEA